MDETASKQHEKEWLKPFRYQKGHSGNPDGRPKGSISIKQKVREYLDEHPYAYEEFIKGVITTRKNQLETWKMLEGAPKATAEITADMTINVNVVAYGDNPTV